MKLFVTCLISLCLLPVPFPLPFPDPFAFPLLRKICGENRTRGWGQLLTFRVETQGAYAHMHLPPSLASKILC